jgi:hypothetical protein
MRAVLKETTMSTSLETVAKESPSIEAKHPQGAQSLRRYCFEAERIDQSTQKAEIGVVARSEEEAWEMAQAEVDDGNVDWVEEESEEGEADLELLSCDGLTEEELAEYLEEQREIEAVEAREQEAAHRRRDLQTLVASLRTATEEERASLIDDLERMVL